MKKFFRVTLVLILLAVLFRGKLYRLVTDYRIVSYRPLAIKPDPRLQEISDSLYRESEDVEDFIQQVQSYTAGELSFRAKNSGTTTALLLAGGEANCVGYARVMTDLLNRNFAAHHPDYRAGHAVMKITVFGIDVHRLTDSPFFRDHDGVVISRGKMRYYVADPSLYDYTRISRVGGFLD